MSQIKFTSKKDPQLSFFLQLMDLCRYYLPMMLEFRNANCAEAIGCAELNLIMSMCKLLDIFLTKDYGVNSADEEHFEDITKIWYLFW